MNPCTLTLRPSQHHGDWQLLLNGIDISLAVAAEGLTLTWRQGRPIATITLMPTEVELDGVTAEAIHAILGETQTPENAVSD